MAKFYGKIGYAETVEEVVDGKTTGVHEEQIVERYYSGDMNRNTRRLQQSGNLNDNISISNELSIISDPYAQQNFHAIRYVEFMGTKWKVTNVEVQYPRLILTLGEVYNA